MAMSKAVLDVKDLSVTFRTREGLVTAVNDISFTVSAGEVWGLSANPARANPSPVSPCSA